MLGEDLVLFRTAEGVAALVDRCPHRGAQLSLGRMLFPDTLSCGYHGWTFNRHGECLAAIVEGPDSKIPGKVRARAYPTEERFGVVWVFVGEGEPPPLDEDLPPQLLEPGILRHFFFEEWACNWRFVTENYPDMCHAPYVHRTFPFMLFRKVPAWAKMHFEPLSDGKGLYVRAIGGGLQAEYPGLGKFPARKWWRFIGGGRAPNPGADVRMPGYIVLGFTEGFFGVYLINVGWPVPIDADRTRYMAIIMTRPRTPLHKLGLLAWYKLYYGVLQPHFVGQDRHLEESQSLSAPEKLSATDAALIRWRRFAVETARQPRAAAHNGATAANAAVPAAAPER
jgi:nitrite reductase/ring-hydroxylating ferredoxin subunit